MIRRCCSMFVIAILTLTVSCSASPPPPIETVITASVEGSAEPTPAKENWLDNGDFLIVKNLPSQAYAGDGIDEFTLWTFDFKNHENIDALLSGEYFISKALLSLTLTPKAKTAWTDAVYIQGSVCNWTAVKFFRPPKLHGKPIHQSTTISHDLIELGMYEPHELLYFLRIEGKGKDPDRFHFWLFSDTQKGDLPMLLRDDSIISAASLTLTFTPRRDSDEGQTFPPPDLPVRECE